jgi:hypothetical protein
MMEAWWNNLNLPLQILYGVGVVSAIMLVIETIMTLFGMDHHHAGDLSFENPGLGMLSLRSITGFFFGFGWSGVIAIKSGLALLPAIGVACVVGFIFLVSVYGLMRAMFSLRADGTLDYNNAIGQVATVYVTIPGNRDGSGQVEVMIRGRLQVISAMTAKLSPLTPQSKVRVTGLIDRSTLEVEPL